MRIKRIIICGISILLGAATISAEKLSVDSVAHRLMYQVWSYPQEKVAITTNAEEYAAGDTIRMDVSLMDASTLLSSELSKFVYVELTNPFGSTCNRVKLKNDDGNINGYIALPSEMSEGLYTLTGYTKFMESMGPDFFFSKPLYIYGSGRPDRMPKFSFSRKGENLRISTELADESNPAVIEISTPNGKTHSSLRKKRDYSVELKREEWKNGIALAKIGNFGLFVPLPSDSTDLKISINPEGGNLVADIINTIGFSISDAVGRGIKLEGKVLDSNGNFITDVSTDRYGYGSFKFMPEKGVSYQMEISGRTYPLQEIDPSATTLQVNPFRKDVVSVVAVGNVPSEAMILVHNDGKLVHYSKIEKNTPYSFKKSELPSGINEMLLLDGNQNVISHRQVFVDKQKNEGHLFDAAIPGFMTRAYDFETSNSDLATRTAIDNIMLASGDCGRYDIPSVIKGIYEEPSSELEIGGEISGIVKSRWRGRPLANAEVSVISRDIDFWNSTKTDGDGRFVINGVDWPEGTKFVVKVVNEKGDYEDNFTIEEDSFPKVNYIIPQFEGDLYVVKELEDADIKDRLSKWLDEVEVVAKAKDDDEDDVTKIFEIIGGRTLDQDYFDSRLVTDYEAAIRAFPGLRVEGGKVVCSGGGRGKEVEIWVDGVKWVPPYEASGTSDNSASRARKQAAINTANVMTGGLLPSDIALAQYASTQSSISDLAASYPFHDVEKIIYIRPGTALIVSNHAGFAGGALMIYTKGKNKRKGFDYDLHLKVISPLGYQKPLAQKSE